MNKNKIPIKVSRVKSLEEFEILQSLGVDYIGLQADNDVFYGLDPNPFWKDDRYLMEEELSMVFSNLDRARKIADIPISSINASNCSQLDQAGFNLIQLPRFKISDLSVIKVCEETNFEIIYGNHYCVPEDDPNFSNLMSEDWLLLHSFELQIFPTEHDAWKTLSNPDPTIANDIINLADIQKLATQRPLFVGLNVTLGNVSEILESFNSIPIKGFSFTLSLNKDRPYHTYEFQELVEIIKSIRS